MNEHDVIHERLCAYALGELEAAERARLERELEGSSELRERLSEVERTIGLVRGAFAGEERLSDAALEELLERAERGVPTPAPRRLRLVPLSGPSMRAAAAVLLLVGGVLGALELQRNYLSGPAELGARPEDTALAKLERNERAAERAKRSGEGGELLRELGYVDAPAPEPVAQGLDGSGSASGTADESKSAPAAQRDMFAASPFDDRSFQGQAGLSAPSSPSPPVVNDAPVAQAEELAWQAWWDRSDDAYLAAEEQARASRVQTGSDAFFLGHGEARQGDGSTYKGPGDSAPSSAPESTRVALGPAAGPSQPGAPPTERSAELESPGYAGERDADDAVERWIGREAGEPAPIDRERFHERELERLLRSCRPWPNERPAAMYFRFWGDNAFEWTRLDALSTFSVDVDTASYALARDYLQRGILPEKAQVRTEEFLNFFDPDLAPPLEEDFAIHTELAPSLFGGSPDRWMLRVGIRGREVARTERKPLVLTFVVDTSGSMQQENRLELVKHALRLLLSELDARDSVALVAYSNEARLLLPMTSVAQRGLIESAIHPLTPNGSTNAEAGLRMGYELALGALTANASNRVVFLSDGVANVGQTDQDRIAADVARHRARGIFLNTIGVGMGNHNDVFLEQLADKGDGVCDYVDSPRAAQRAIVERFTGAFETIASDVKVQVEFDPAQVESYRLLGYENRAIADADFRNDAVDAGEVGAGHQVVALYELVRSGATADGPLATVRLRWKQPKSAGSDPLESDVTEIERGIGFRQAAGSFGGTSPGYRRSVLVAQFAEVLRRSTHARGDSYERLLEETRRLEAELGDADFGELRLLVERARSLILAEVTGRGELERLLDEYRSLQFECALLRELERHQDEESLRRREAQIVERLRELLRQR